MTPETKDIIKTRNLRIFEKDKWFYYGIPCENGEVQSGIPEITNRLLIEILISLKDILRKLK